LRRESAVSVHDAIAYRKRGWSIIPTTGKKAAVRWSRYQKRLADDAKLGDWFVDAKGITGLAVILGSVSGGLACRDFDDADAYRRWARAHHDLAATLPTVETPRGAHVYFRGPEGFQNLGDGEYRADTGHYCLLPPSLHPSGQVYRWLNPLLEGPLQELDPHEVGLCSVTLAESKTTPESLTHTNPLHALVCVPNPDCNFGPAITEAIAATMPTGPGQRNRQVGFLVRKLKAIPGLGTSSGTLRRIVREWHRLALPVIRTKDFDTTWMDFATAWSRMLPPVSFERAAVAAKQEQPHPAALRYEKSELRQLVTLCACLQQQWGDDYFFLGAREAANWLGVSAMAAHRMFKTLMLDGLLKQGKKGSKQTKKATEWRFVGDLQEQTPDIF